MPPQTIISDPVQTATFTVSAASELVARPIGLGVIPMEIKRTVRKFLDRHANGCAHGRIVLVWAVVGELERRRYPQE